MSKNTIKYIGILAVSFLLFSCSSSPQASKEMPSAAAYSSSYSRDAASGEMFRAAEINDERMVTYSANLTLSVHDIEESRKALIEYVKNIDGFVVVETQNFITSRIPSESMDNFINYSKTLGKIENESKTGTDITDQYRDNVMRLESLKSIRDRYTTLLERANSVTDILSIEKELERVNLEIERLEGRIKHAELSVTYSSITVRFTEKAKPGPVGWIFYGLYRGIKWLFVWD